jgi:hypothetical protein
LSPRRASQAEDSTQNQHRILHVIFSFEDILLAIAGKF